MKAKIAAGIPSSFRFLFFLILMLSIFYSTVFSQNIFDIATNSPLNISVIETNLTGFSTSCSSKVVVVRLGEEATLNNRTIFFLSDLQSGGSGSSTLTDLANLIKNDPSKVRKIRCLSSADISELRISRNQLREKEAQLKLERIKRLEEQKTELSELEWFEWIYRYFKLSPALTFDFEKGRIGNPRRDKTSGKIEVDDQGKVLPRLLLSASNSTGYYASFLLLDSSKDEEAVLQGFGIGRLLGYDPRNSWNVGVGIFGELDVEILKDGFKVGDVVAEGSSFTTKRTFLSAMFTIVFNY